MFSSPLYANLTHYLHKLHSTISLFLQIQLQFIDLSLVIHVYAYSMFLSIYDYWALVPGVFNIKISVQMFNVHLKLTGKA